MPRFYKKILVVWGRWCLLVDWILQLGVVTKGYLTTLPIRSLELATLIWSPSCCYFVSTSLITWIGLQSLVCVNFFIIQGIPDMIRNYYHIDSKRLGLLQTSFIISYMFLSPVFGYLGDRWKRKYLMVIGLFVWSMVSLGSSFVSSNVIFLHF